MYQILPCLRLALENLRKKREAQFKKYLIVDYASTQQYLRGNRGKSVLY